MKKGEVGYLDPFKQNEHGCGQETSRHQMGNYYPWVCTRPKGHTGPHAAHTISGEQNFTWLPAHVDNVRTDNLIAGVYRHYKGGFYQLIGLAEHSETEEHLVIYMALTGAHMPGPRLRARPLTGPNGWSTSHNGKPRFVYVGQEIPEAARQSFEPRI